MRKTASVSAMEEEMTATSHRFATRDERMDNRDGEVNQKFIEVEETQEMDKEAIIAADAASREAVIAADTASKEAVLTAGAENQEATVSRLDHEASGLPALRSKMDKTLLPLTGEEIPEQLNPITLMDLPQYIFWNESDHPFQFGGGSLKRESGTWDNGEEVIIVIETKSGESWDVIWDEKFTEEADFERKPLPQLYNDGIGLRISIKQKNEGDGFHIWSYSFISAEREE